MNISGCYRIEALRDVVWPFLFDVDTLMELIPGCYSLEKVGEDEYLGQIRVGLAGISGNYHTKVRIIDKVPPHHLYFYGEVSGKTGVFKGHATIDLQEEGKDCLFLYQADGIISGALSTFNPRYIEGVVQTLLKLGFSKFTRKVSSN